MTRNPIVVLTMLAARRLWVAQAEKRYLLALAELLPDTKEAAKAAGVGLRSLHRLYNRYDIPWRKGTPGRGNRHVLRWGPEVVEKAKKMRREGMYVAAIARELGPSVSWVVRNTWDEIDVHQHHQGRGRPRKNERPCP